MSEIAIIGDIAVLNVDKENREWGYNPAPDGTEVELVGYAESFYSRRQSFCKKPGVYECHTWPKVELPSGDVISINAHNLKFLNDKRIAWDAGKFLRDLPETTFWEYDEVRYIGKRERYGDDRFIFSIHYNNIGQFCNDGVTPLPLYDVSPTIRGGSYSSYRESELELVARGDIWKYYHGEKLEFPSLKAEAEFFQMLGHTDEVRNPRSSLYCWNWDEAQESAREGLIDCLSVSNGLFGGGVHMSAIRFHDRVLGEKIREEFLCGKQ